MAKHLIKRINSKAFWTMVLCLFVSQVAGQEFKVESQVYHSASTAPIAQNLTLFSNGIAYDFEMAGGELKAGSEMVIYDSRRRTVILLNPVNQTRLEMADLRLLKIVEGIRKETALDNRTSFLVNDEYQEETDLSGGWVRVSSPHIAYRAFGRQPASVANLPLYYQFLESVTHLMATDPQKMPPFARIRLNRSIKRMGWFPSEVQFSAAKSALFKEPVELKMTHLMIDGLSEKDLARIKRAKQDWGRFKLVDLAEFRNLPDQPKIAFGRQKKEDSNAQKR